VSSSACQCQGQQSPETVNNPPGLSTIAYRLGDFATFRAALLQPQDGESALAGWHPSEGDLALQLLEWWAYLGDILTFYNERIANESYLGTAELPASLAGLVALIGYRPRPALGATGQVAAIRTAARPNEPLVIAAGAQLANSATPGVPVQTFETAAATFSGLSDVPIELRASPSLLDVPTGSVLLAGVVGGLKPGDALVLVPAAPWSSSPGSVEWAQVTVVSTSVVPDPNGGRNTRVVLDGVQPWMRDPGTRAADYRLLRPTQAAALWTQTPDAALIQVSPTKFDVHLSAAVRGIAPGDTVFIAGGQFSSAVAVVTDVSEQFRSVPYPNPSGTTPPPPDIPIAHTVLSVTVGPTSLTGFLAAPAGLTAQTSSGAGSLKGLLHWQVTALTSAGETTGSNEVSLTVTGSATLTWNEVFGATGYNVYRASASGGEATGSALVTVTPTTAATYTDTGGAPETGTVPARNSAALAGAADPTAVAVRFGLKDVGTLIGAPATELTALPAVVTPRVAGQLTAPTGLAIVWTSAPGGGDLAGQVSWQVTALSGLGETSPSPAVEATGFDQRVAVTLSWNAVAGATGYNLYRFERSGPAQLVARIQSGSTTSYTDTGAMAEAAARSRTAPRVNTAVLGLSALASGTVAAFVEDVTGTGIPVSVSATGAGVLMLLAADATPGTFSLTAPLRLLVDLVDISRGATVSGERLGTGNAAVAGQAFTLKQSPLTYLASGPSYASTLKVFVEGIEWAEVASFFAQPAQANVFVISQLPDGTSQVGFGDGVNGARLPTGSTVMANYRYGGGAASPPAGRLTTILRPQPNLAAVHNPVAVSGGADAEDPASIRVNGPASVLTFGRAISADDYETVAALAPGVARARAYWTWDPNQQRRLVKIYVGDDIGAKAAADGALAGAEDPNRPLSVALASPIPVTVSGTLLIAANRIASDVLAAAVAALADPATGFFSAGSLGIGQQVYSSEVESALQVDGVLAVHSLTLTNADGADIFDGSTSPVGVADPGEGRFYALAAQPDLTAQVANA